MSDGVAGSLFTTVIFNPALLRKEDLVRGFVARQDVLDRLLDDLRRVQPGSAPQHQLLVGQRGLGKTTLLRRLAFAIEDDPQLSSAWLPLVFPEEQYNVKSLSDFWLNCADALSDALDRLGDKPAADALDQKVESVPADPKRRSAAALALLVDEAERLGRGLVLLVDNMDIVLDRLDQKEEWEFRRVISAEHRLYFVGASSRALEALYEHGRAFYDYFQVQDLRGLSDAEMFALLRRLAVEAGDQRVQQLIEEKAGRVRALRVLTGGNPRTLILLYRVLSEGPDGDVQRDIEQLLDLYTPLYKARFEELAPQSQQVLDAMAIHWDPVTAADLADKLAPLSVNQVSAQLKRLEDFGAIEKTPWFGENKAAFQIAERFFNIWYLMRASRRVRRRLIWLVKFLESWFEREEISERAQQYLQRDPKTIGAEMALAYSQAVDDPRLRRGLESAGLRAAIDESVRGQFDFSDLPAEVQGRYQRMERLRDLRARVLAMRLEGVDVQELWRLLGGSPHLVLEEKAKVVDELPSLDASGAQKLFANLERAERQLKEAYPGSAAEVSRLYEALGAGEITGVYDVEGALAMAGLRGSQWLPVIAIASRTDPWCMPESLSEHEVGEAEHAWRTLASEPAYTAKAISGLGGLQARLGRYADAEQSSRRAIELDPQSSYSWSGLGSLLRDCLGRHEEAEQAYRRAIDLNPRSAALWDNLGRVLYNRPGKYGEAEQAYRRAIELDPQAAYPLSNLGNLFQDRLGRYEEAEQAYRRAIELDPQFELPRNNLGNLLQSLGRYEEAEQSYRRAIELDPHYAASWNGLGVLLWDAGRQEEAEQAYRQAIELDPRSPYPWGNLASLMEQYSDRQEEALADFFKAAELDPTNDGRRSEALRIARSLGTGSKQSSAVALESVSHLHGLFPEDWSVKFVLAGLLALSDDWARARELLTELAASETDQPDIWTFGAMVKAGYLSEAIELLEQTGANERWRPLYEALRAVQAGSKQYLRRVALEVRIVAEAILEELAPNLPKKGSAREATRRSARPRPRTNVSK
jgi:Flp pilus assembly protein TadD